MPHVDLKFKPGRVSGQILHAASQEITEIVGRHFEEYPAYVSVEVLPQTEWTLHRKDVDLEINASPDAEGQRARAAVGLAQELGDWLQHYLQSKRVDCEISVWVRVFEQGVYEYRGPSG
jgi:hypothetical protein